MNKNTFFSIVIIGLLVSNIILIGFIVMNKPPRGPHPHTDPKTIIIKKLQLDDEQIIQYEELIKEHQANINKLDQNIKMLQSSLYEGLSSDNAIVSVDSFTTQISIIQKQIEELHYNHFMAIKAICNEEQLREYDELILELTSIFFDKPKPAPKH